MFDLFADVRSAIDGDACDDPKEMKHIGRVDVGMVAYVWRLFSSQLSAFLLQMSQLAYRHERVQLYKVEQTILKVERSQLLFKKVLRQLVVTVVIDFPHEV